MGAATPLVVGLVVLLVLLLVGVFVWWKRRSGSASEPEPRSAPRVDLVRHAPLLTEDRRWPPSAGAGESVIQPRSAPVPLVDLIPRGRPGGRPMTERDVEHVGQRLAVRELTDLRDVRRGRVGRAADGSEVKLLDQPVARSTSIQSFQDLVSRQQNVTERLRAADPRIETCWPTQVVTTYDGSVDGYHRVPLAEKFWLSSTDLEVPRSLNLAVDLRGQVGTEEISPTQAREVVVLASTFVHVLHDSGLAHGELAFHNIVYSVGADLSICMLDFEATRAVGRPSLRGPDPSEAHWLDPHARHLESSLDSDRYQLALLAFRLLVTRTRNSVIDPRAVPRVLDGFDEHQTSLLRGLWERASGLRGQRPNTHEWLHALGPRG